MIFDNRGRLIDLLEDYHRHFAYPGHTRATKHNSCASRILRVLMDTNLTQFGILSDLLACVISIGPLIEQARIQKERDIVFSYRFSANAGDLFDRQFSWPQFIASSVKRSDDYKFIVSCDIADFYSRLGHHRLENALQHLNDPGNTRSRIMRILSNFSNTQIHTHRQRTMTDGNILKAELEKFDIMAISRSELAKSRIHAALSKKIVSAIRYLSERREVKPFCHFSIIQMYSIRYGVTSK